MSKKFAKRISKKNRKQLDLSDKLTRDLLKWGDEKLLQGVQLDEVYLKDINVKEQVRTKFNDKSIRELGENIKLNGLIQPLVVHLNEGRYTLICGERRFRAMTLIEKKSAPCFILKNKTEDELMAIQFSENSSREELHYIDKADGILNYYEVTQASERKIQNAMGISKSEVHRSLLIARLPEAVKEAAKIYNIEKYVLIEFDMIKDEQLRQKIQSQIVSGEMKKRTQLRRFINQNTDKETALLKAKSPAKTKASDILKAALNNNKSIKIDKKTQMILDQLLEEAETQ